MCFTKYVVFALLFHLGTLCHFPFLFIFVSFSCMIVETSKWFNKLLFPIITYDIGRYFGLKVEPNGKYIQSRRAIHPSCSYPMITKDYLDLSRMFHHIQKVIHFLKVIHFFPQEYFFINYDLTTFICFVRMVFHHVEISLWNPYVVF